jgi:plasmid maintenance system antidote protein VapI
MKTRIFTLFLCVFLLSLFTNAALAQEKQKENGRAVTGKMRGQQKMEHSGMTYLQKMGGAMDSCTTKCDKMIEQTKQMDVQGIMGGQMGMDTIMGTAQSLKGMADQMKMINQHINNMMNNKEITDNKVCVEKIKEMYAMMVQTTRNLNQMTDLSQKMMEAMQKQPAEK